MSNKIPFPDNGRPHSRESYGTGVDKFKSILNGFLDNEMFKDETKFIIVIANNCPTDEKFIEMVGFATSDILENGIDSRKKRFVIHKSKENSSSEDNSKEAK